MKNNILVFCSLTALKISNAQINTIKESDFIQEIAPSLIGDFHNEAFNRLNNALALIPIEIQEQDIFDQTVNVLKSFCNEDDEECEALAYESVVSAITNRAPDILEKASALPHDLDSAVIDSITAVNEAMKLLKSRDSVTVLDILRDIWEHTEAIEVTNYKEKAVGIGVTSVAIACTELWSNMATDPRKRTLVQKTAKFRRCGTDRCFQAASLPLAEYGIAGAVFGSISMRNFYLPGLMTSILFQAIAWSLYGFLDLINAHDYVTMREKYL